MQLFHKFNNKKYCSSAAAAKFLGTAYSSRPGGRVLSIFVRRGCDVFQGIVFSYLFLNDVSKEGNLSGDGCENMPKGQLRSDYHLVQFCALEYTFHRFF